MPMRGVLYARTTTASRAQRRNHSSDAGFALRVEEPPMVVLVVEDEVLIGIALCMILRVAGHRVWGPAGTVGEAVDMAASEAPDVALVDLNLQGNADGLDLARTLQRQHGTTCIFLT